MKADIVLSNDATVLEAAKRILKTCQSRFSHSLLWHKLLWKGEEFWLCGGDCQKCGVGRAMRLFIKIEEANNTEEIKEREDKK